MTSLRERATAEEQMDAAELPPEDYAAVLADLARVNAVTLAAVRAASPSNWGSARA